MATLDLLGFSATAIILMPGLMFGIGLSFAIDRYIGVFAVTRRVILIPGCLAGFGIIGAVLEFTAINFTHSYLQQPTIRCATYLAASATGFLLIATLLSWVIDVFRWKSHLSLWFIGTSVGFVAISAVLELSRITGQASVSMLVANTAFQVITLGAIGWKLAVAQTSQIKSQQT